MKSLIELCVAIKAQWQIVASTRAAEQTQLNAITGEANSFAYFATEIDRWQASLSDSQKSGKRRIATTSLIQKSISQTLRALQYALTFHANGIQWMLDHRSLSTLLIFAGAQIDMLERELQKDRAALMETAKLEFTDSLQKIEHAAEIAPTLEAQVKSLTDNSNIALKAIADVETKRLQLEETVADSIKKAASLFVDAEKENKDSRDSLQKDISKIRVQAESKLVELNNSTREKGESLEASITDLKGLVATNAALSAEISGFHNKALNTSNEALVAKERAQQDLVDAKDALADANEKLEGTKAALNSALLNVRRQGLSGAFFEKVQEIKEQHNGEQKRFQSALIYLAAIGVLGLIIELTQGMPSTFDQWLIRIVRLLILAAPGVWIAWLAAKRLEALNRILSDYEYKSATALAFESYRQEVDASGNADLKEELLRKAVVTFGENPTRYYDSSKDISVMPAESMFEKAKGMFSANQSATHKPNLKAVESSLSESSVKPAA